MRIGIAILGLISVLSGMRWLTPQPADSFSTNSLPQTICLGVPYDVSTHNGMASLDLELKSDDECLLIVGSLGSADETYSVELTAKSISQVERQPFSKIAPLPAPVSERSFSNSQNRQPALVCKSSEVCRRRDFYIHVREGALDDPRCYQRVSARLLAEGRDVRVYLDEDQLPSELAPEVTEELVRIFDEQILPVSRIHLGMHRDVDGDGKFAVLLTHWLGKLRGGGTTVGGFVRGSDFDPDIAPPFGNQADVMYLNSQVRTGTELRTLLAHEYAHAVLFSVKDGGDEEDWLNEAIAHLAENMHGAEWSNLDHRLDTFLKDPSKSPLVVADYYQSGRWRDHGCRGATYLFLRWCVDQCGVQLLGQLSESPETGVDNIARATGATFPELFRHWAIAMAQPPSSTDSDGTVGPFRFLSLYDRVGDYLLTGPKIQHWELPETAKPLKVQGTAVSFLEISPGRFGGRYRISLRSTTNAKLQVTLIRRGETNSQTTDENPHFAHLSARQDYSTIPSAGTTSAAR